MFNNDFLRVYSADQTGDADGVTSWTNEVNDSSVNPDKVAIVPYQGTDEVLVIYTLNGGGTTNDGVYSRVITAGGGAGAEIECGNFDSLPDFSNPVRISDTDFRIIITPTGGSMVEYQWNDTLWSLVSTVDTETDQASPSLFYDRISDDMYLFSIDTGTDDVERHYKPSGGSWQAEVVADDGEATTHSYPVTQMSEPPVGSARTTPRELVWAYRVLNGANYDLKVGTLTTGCGPATLPFFDDFNRVDSTAVGNCWTETDGPGLEAQILGNRLNLESGNDVNMPMVVRTFTQQTSGLLRWTYIFNWAKDAAEANYELWMQLGDSATMVDPAISDSTGVAVNLKWASPSYGMTNEAGFGYVTGDGSTTQEVQVLNGGGDHTIEVIADLDFNTFDLSIDGQPCATTSSCGIAFDNNVDIDAIRIYTDELSTFNGFTASEFDDILIEVDNHTPDIGSNVDFTLTVTNGGPDGATGLEVTDALPTGYTYVSDTPSVGTYNSGTGVWTIGNLANGASANLIITATVNAAGNYTNNAEVTAVNESDPDSTPGDGIGDDFDSVTTTPLVGGGSCPAPSLIFSDGFESGNLSAWDGFTTGSGDSIGASTEQFNTGSYSAKAEVDNVSTHEAFVFKGFAGQTTVYARIRVYIDSGFSTSDWAEIMYFLDNGSNIIGTEINEDMTLFLYNEVAFETYYSLTTISTDVWHTLEMMAFINGANSEARLWLDGNIV
ncbi:MAG: DUF11 domain-containing protein, partial [Planctomycetota bacterium]